MNISKGNLILRRSKSKIIMVKLFDVVCFALFCVVFLIGSFQDLSHGTE